ncbi:MAG: YkgJ family cysteine cluster protein [Thermoguttaceae bacterium]|nr:YkgJ family cysteine cluster protein [Thermoguttaceae bacterium]MDW8036604.1 YkgJ family cysteine cluster protein [Thermoguttaceae bacterium]
MSNQLRQQPWFHKGLRFQCAGCGRCCSGGPGFVWVNQQEIHQLALYLKLPIEDFLLHYVRAVGNRWSLRERNNGDCVFLHPKTRRCLVYPVRPRQCQSWPFWLANLRTPADWAYVSRICPGSGQGPLYTLEQIQSLLWWSGLEKDGLPPQEDCPSF